MGVCGCGPGAVCSWELYSGAGARVADGMARDVLPRVVQPGRTEVSVDRRKGGSSPVRHPVRLRAGVAGCQAMGGVGGLGRPRGWPCGWAYQRVGMHLHAGQRGGALGLHLCPSTPGPPSAPSER